MEDGKNLGTGERMALELKPGVVNNINNPNPSNWDVEIETARGSLITLTIPAGGTFGIKPMDDLARVTINVRDVVPFGPRAVDSD